LKLKRIKFDFGLGYPLGELYSAPLAGFQGPTSKRKGAEERRCRKGKGGEGKEAKEENGKEGK